MKKFVLALMTTGIIAFGSGPVLAQTTIPAECGEPATRTGAVCDEFYVNAQPPVPPAQPTTTTTMVIVVDSGATLPKTGGTMSPFLGMGALLLAGGGIVVVASRRRATATPS